MIRFLDKLLFTVLAVFLSIWGLLLLMVVTLFALLAQLFSPRMRPDVAEEWDASGQVIEGTAHHIPDKPNE